MLSERCSNVILLTLNRFWPAAYTADIEKKKVGRNSYGEKIFEIPAFEIRVKAPMEEVFLSIDSDYKA